MPEENMPMSSSLLQSVVEDITKEMQETCRSEDRNTRTKGLFPALADCSKPVISVLEQLTSPVW